MTKDRQNYIEEVANLVRKNTIGFDKFPVNPREIIIQLGGTVEYSKLPRSDFHIKKVGDSFILVLNDERPSCREIETLACAIGNLFIHMGYKINLDKWSVTEDYDSSAYLRGVGRYSTELAEAETFMSELLMPRKDVTSICKEDREKLATYFGVSKSRVTNRLRFLGLERW